MKKKEAKWQTIWGQYLREMRERGTPLYGYFELKQTVNKTLPFSAIEDHQNSGLQATEESGLIWKYSDEDSRLKMCDCSSTPPLPSYLVIKFPDSYYMIRIGEIVRMREQGEVSITVDQAKTIAERIIKLG